jgi:hypothetical protein
MALTLDVTTDKAISLEEYLDHVATAVDVRDQDAVVESAGALKALANNRSFLVDKLNAELMNWSAFQPDNGYSSQTLALGGGDGFFVRANMWTPPSRGNDTWEWENKLYAYSQPHDHNFSFLTVGYLGSGYATSIYEYDPATVAGLAGEDVALTFLEETTLPQGKIMFYRASRDVHSQEHPEEFSISLNLMIISPEISASSQYWFDLENRKIKDHVQNAGTGRIALCKLASFIANGETVEALERISSGHLLPRVRAAAYASLAHVLKGAGDRVWERAADDSHAYVVAIARQALRDLASR